MSIDNPALVSSITNHMSVWYGESTQFEFRGWPEPDDIDIPFALSLLLTSESVYFVYDGTVVVMLGPDRTYEVTQNRFWDLYNCVRNHGHEGLSLWVDHTDPHQWGRPE